MKTQLNEIKRMQRLAGIISESQFLSEAKYFTKLDDVKKEIAANKGAVAIFKV
jgi:hypothetical protein